MSGLLRETIMAIGQSYQPLHTPVGDIERFTPTSQLARLWREAADASEALSHYCRVENRDLDEHELGRLEDAASDARQALRDHLLFSHGLTTRDLDRDAL